MQFAVRGPRVQLNASGPWPNAELTQRPCEYVSLRPTLFGVRLGDQFHSPQPMTPRLAHTRRERALTPSPVDIGIYTGRPGCGRRQSTYQWGLNFIDLNFNTGYQLGIANADIAPFADSERHAAGTT